MTAPPSYGYPPAYEYPKENCTTAVVTETVETCVPAFRQVCEDVTDTVISVVDREQCYPVTKTLCTEQRDLVDNEVCVFDYTSSGVEVEAATVSVEFEVECVTQIVTVCDPGYGYEVSKGII